MKQLEIFVLMPYGANGEYGGGPVESDYVFNEIIEPAVTQADRLLWPGVLAADHVEPRVIREVNRNESGSITSAIVRNIAQADVVIVDITGRNPNVFLELGIRYALRSKVTILLAQVGTQIPFDIKMYRYIEYEKFRPAQARNKVAQCICQGLTGSLKSDSVVFDILPSMSVSIPGIAESFGADAIAKQEIMSWDEYMGRIEDTCVYLQIALQEYRFLPNAVIGITNGGLVAADLIGKRVFAGRDTPVLSLWAKRHVVDRESAFWYFDNEFNDATLQCIQTASKGRRITILLIDDHMGTGSTAVQATTYIKNRLGDETILVFVPIVSRRSDNIGVVEDLLPYKARDAEGKPIFKVSKEEFLTKLNTRALYFPYLSKQVNVSTSG
jgi:hypoxanthine phosphoribosyltransferase